MSLRLVLFAAALAGVLMISQGALAQRRPSAPPAPPPSAEKAAIFDLTGYWVSVVTEDWRWRMMTPPKGDYASVPLNPAGRKVADEFNPTLYGGARYQISQIIDCRAYGAAGLMRMPLRVHISWDNPNVLKFETDRGEQMRLLHFLPGHPYENTEQPITAQAEATEANRGPSMQGDSVAAWEQAYHLDASSFQRGPPVNDRPGLGRTALGIAQPGGDLAVVTTDLAPGWLRRNGVPYGSQARLIEHYQTFQDPSGASWFDVTTQVDDPEYLNAPFVTSSDFQREPDGSKWEPHPCRQVAED